MRYMHMLLHAYALYAYLIYVYTHKQSVSLLSTAHSTHVADADETHVLHTVRYTALGVR